jgi:hypothetical protein
MLMGGNARISKKQIKINKKGIKQKDFRLELSGSPRDGIGCSLNIAKKFSNEHAFFEKVFPKCSLAQYLRGFH